MFPSYICLRTGAAAQFWTHLNSQTYRINAFVNKINSTGYLTRTDYDTIGAEVLAQCDELDGVKDNVITDPLVCRPELSVLSCDQPTANQSTCLSYEKINTMYTIWNDYHSVTTSEWLFPGFMPGSEGLAAFSVTGQPFGPGLFFSRSFRPRTACSYSLSLSHRSRLLLLSSSEPDHPWKLQRN